MAQSNVTDSPLLPSQTDQLGQSTYAQALTNFLTNAKTPTTVAIQGEWGSGKTSMMNTIAGQICINYSSLYDGITDDTETLNEDAPYIGVWINTWQYSLLKDDKDALLSVIDGVTQELSTQMDQFMKTSAKVKEVGRRLLSSMTGFAMSAAKMGISAAGISPNSLDHIAEMVQTQKKGPAHFKKQLQDTVNIYLEEITQNPRFKNAKGFIFFIDDLDRLDPPVAVQILSLLKNLFEVRHCLFVLAVDYEVVIKGLEKQFGKKTEENEREFRSFFDKIIQLTFRMPMDNYQTNDYLKENLLQIDFCDPKLLEKTDFLEALNQMTICTCGKNPRSIKRMLNTLSLIHEVHAISQQNNANDNILDQEIYLALLLAIVSIQVAYPLLYENIVRRPNLYLWEKQLDEADLELDDDSTEGNESRYQISPNAFDLAALTEKDPWLKKRSSAVGMLLSLIVKLIYENQKSEDINNPDFGNTAPHLRRILEISHVTSVGEEMTGKDSENNRLFYIKLGNGQDVNATMQATDAGYVVLKGSKIRTSTTPSCPASIVKRHLLYKDHIDENGIIDIDIPFRTPSGASGFCLGASSNGRVAWKDENGITLEDIENNTVNRPSRTTTDTEVDDTSRT